MSESAKPENKMPKFAPVRAYGAVADKGPVRQLNEDAYIAVPDRQLFGVADGYGGINIGDAAARKCLENVKYFVEHGLGDRRSRCPSYTGAITPRARTSSSMPFSTRISSSSTRTRKSRSMAAAGRA